MMYTMCRTPCMLSIRKYHVIYSWYSNQLETPHQMEEAYCLQGTYVSKTSKEVIGFDVFFVII